MAEEQKKQSVASAVVTLVLIGVGVWYYFGGGLEQQVDRNMDDIYKKVSSDAVAQYNITKKNGNRMDQCVHAGVVAGAFLQAKDEANYKRWKDTEAKDCAAAGLPNQR